MQMQPERSKNWIVLHIFKQLIKIITYKEFFL